MSDDREQRATGAETRSGGMPRQRETPRTERLDATATNPRWRPSRATSVGSSTVHARTLWDVLPRWLQKRGWPYIIVLIVLFFLIVFFVLSSLRGDRREAPISAPEPTAITLPTVESGLVSGDNPVDATTQPVLPPAPRFFVVVNTGGQGLFLRPQPNRNNEPITTLPDGTRLQQIGEDVPGSDFVWRPVRTPDGLEGYVAVDFLEPAE
ncbi:MAG: SH3 domain-containing protein [Chloroflexus sp.]